MILLEGEIRMTQTIIKNHEEVLNDVLNQLKEIDDFTCRKLETFYEIVVKSGRDTYAIGIDCKVIEGYTEEGLKEACIAKLKRVGWLKGTYA